MYNQSVTVFRLLTILSLVFSFTIMDAVYGQSRTRGTHGVPGPIIRRDGAVGQFQTRGTSKNLYPGVKTNSDVSAGNTAAPVGKNYALLIGVNTYYNKENKIRAEKENRIFFELGNLNCCCNDMIGLSKSLIGQFAPENNITVLTSNAAKEDARPTLENINRHLEDILGRLKENDSIFIAFAGHGLALPNYKGDDKSDLYLCPMDAEVICNPTTGKFDNSRLLSREDIEKQLEKSNASVKILVMDACRDRDALTRSVGGSDSMSQTAKAEIEKIKSYDLPNSSTVKGLFQLFSCANGETATEGIGEGEDITLKHGVYSYYMIEGLKGAADKNKDGKISLSELQQYAQKKTSDYVLGAFPGRKQSPKISLNADSTGEDIILAFCKPAPSIPTDSTQPQNTTQYTAQQNMDSPHQISNESKNSVSVGNGNGRSGSGNNGFKTPR